MMIDDCLEPQALSHCPLQGVMHSIHHTTVHSVGRFLPDDTAAHVSAKPVMPGTAVLAHPTIDLHHSLNRGLCDPAVHTPCRQWPRPSSRYPRLCLHHSTRSRLFLLVAASRACWRVPTTIGKQAGFQASTEGDPAACTLAIGRKVLHTIQSWKLDMVFDIVSRSPDGMLRCLQSDGCSAS